jgi:hypothetical protein
LFTPVLPFNVISSPPLLYLYRTLDLGPPLQSLQVMILKKTWNDLNKKQRKHKDFFTSAVNADVK